MNARWLDIMVLEQKARVQKVIAEFLKNWQGKRAQRPKPEQPPEQDNAYRE